MALPLKKDDKTPKLTFVKGNNEGDDVDIFGDAKKKEKPKAGKLEKITVNVPGLQDKLIARQNLKAELDDLKVLFESVQSELKEIGREKFLELYKKHGANHKSFYINDENGCVRVTPSDKYIALTEERAEQLIKKYGEDIVTVDTKFIFNPEVLSRNMEIIKKIIKETKEISIEDKKDLINRQDTYTVSKGAIDKLSAYDKNIVEVMADIQPIFALYDCSSPEKETGGDLLGMPIIGGYSSCHYAPALDGHICSHCRKECDVMTEQELMHQIAEDSNEGERRKTGGYAMPMPRGKEYEVSIGENVYWGTYSIADNKIMMETCLTFNEEGQEVEVQDNDTRALVYAKVEADHSDEIMDESEYAHELRYEKAADQMGYATGGTMETQKVVLQPYNYSGMGRKQLVFVDTKYAHPDTGKSMMWGYSKTGDVADFKGLFEPTGEKIELEYNVKSSQTANQQKSARVTAIREYVGEMKAGGGKLENAVWGGVRGALKQPILSAKKRDYTVNVDTKTLEVDVNITGADTVDQSALNDAAEWTQFHWGYMVYPKNIDELLATMKVLKVKTSRNDLLKFLPDAKMVETVMNRANEMLKDEKINAIYQSFATKEEAEDWIAKSAQTNVLAEVEKIADKILNYYLPNVTYRQVFSYSDKIGDNMTKLGDYLIDVDTSKDGVRQAYIDIYFGNKYRNEVAQLNSNYASYVRFVEDITDGEHLMNVEVIPDPTRKTVKFLFSDGKTEFATGGGIGHVLNRIDNYTERRLPSQTVKIYLNQEPISGSRNLAETYDNDFSDKHEKAHISFAEYVARHKKWLINGKKHMATGGSGKDEFIIVRCYWGNKEDEKHSETTFKDYIKKNPIKNVWIGLKKIDNFKFDVDNNGRMIMRYSLRKGSSLKYYVSFLNHSVALKNNNAVFLWDINYADWKNKILTKETLELLNTEATFAKGGPSHPAGCVIDEDGVDHFAAARTRGLDSVDYEQEAMEYAGEHWHTLTAKERRDLIEEMEYNRFASGGEMSAQKTIVDTRGNTFFLTKIDSTHFYLSTSPSEKGNALHIGQIRNEPYYNEVNNWLNDKALFEVGEIVWDSEHNDYGVVLDVFERGDVKLDSDGIVSDTYLHKLGSDADSGEKIDLIQAMLRHKRLVDKFPNRYARINYAKGGGLDERAFAQLNKLKSEGKLKRYFDVRGNGQKLFETIIPNKSEKGMYKRYESSSASSLGVLQNEYLDETDILNYLKKTLPKLISREDITILGVPRNKITDREWESILEMAKHLDGATFILKDENFNDVKPQVEYEWYVNEPKAKGGDRKKYIEKEQKWFGKKLATGGGAGKKITQEQAHEILVRNNMFAGGNVPFDKTTNYIGMLEEINAHRRIWNAKELN